MSDMLYIQTDKNMKVLSEQVQLQDIAQLTSNNPAVLNRCKVLRVITLPKGKYGRYTVSAIELVDLIQKKEEKVEVTHMGEPEFILTYEDPGRKKEWLGWCKTVFVCLLTFFGTMFSIMTFNTDVDIPTLFQNIYRQFMGESSDGFNVLAIGYSLGNGIGVIFFFNHFGRWKITQDPTPIEVEMRTYEDEVDNTILEMENRKEN